MSGGGGDGGGGDGGRRQVSTLLGCGCAVLISLFMVTVVITTFATYRAGKRLQEMADDPRLAADAVREVVPYTELPAGLAPRGTLSVPWMMDVAFFGGPGAPGDDDEFDRGFVFVKVREFLDRGGRTHRWLTSGEGDDTPIEQQQIAFRPREVIARGELTVDDTRVTWSTRRGEVEIDLAAEEDGGEGDEGAAPAGGENAVLALFAIDCGDDGWERLGMWFVEDPAPDTPMDQVDWDGTPADPRAIEDFLARFRICA